MKRQKAYIDVYEDEHIIVVNKSAEVLSIPDRFDQSKLNLQSLLKKRFGEIFTVHRLDFGTSGIVLFAKHAEAHAYYSQLFERREAEKYYRAICHPAPALDEGMVEVGLNYDQRVKKQKIDLKGKPAITLFRIHEHLGSFAVLDIKIETGKQHQIRAHMEYLGSPLVGDPKYGGLEAFYLSEWKPQQYKINQDSYERPLIARPALHAARLIVPSFDDKTNVLTLVAELPKDMKACINQMRKLN